MNVCIWHDLRHLVFISHSQTHKHTNTHHVRENWGITGPISATSSATSPSAVKPAAAPSPSVVKPAALAYRKVSKDEIRAMLKKLDGMSKDKAMSGMYVCVYVCACAR